MRPGYLDVDYHSYLDEILPVINKSKKYLVDKYLDNDGIVWCA